MKMTKEILSELRRQMNGAVSQSMREMGHTESLNMGVSLPTIKSIALRYAPDDELAERLSCLQSREARIAALYIADPKNLTIEIAQRWSSTWQTEEIARLSAMLLLSQSPIAQTIATIWITPSTLIDGTKCLENSEEVGKELTKSEINGDISIENLRKIAALYIIGRRASTIDRSLIETLLLLLGDVNGAGQVRDNQGAGLIYALREIYANVPSYRPRIAAIAESIDDLKWQLEIYSETV